MKLPSPFLPVEMHRDGMNTVVNVVDREITFGVNSLPISIKSKGTELLAAPVRFVGVEDGQPIVWRDDYEDNESESFIQRHDDEQVVLCGAMASPRFIIDTCITTEYDGNMSIDMKLMTMGQTVAQGFGLAPLQKLRYRLDKLWLEIPLKKELAPFYSVFPNSDFTMPDGTVQKESHTTDCGKALPGMAFPFKTLFWLGSEEKGLGFFADRDKNWQPESGERVMEIVEEDDALILRVHLLDSHPKAWKADPELGRTNYRPISFSFGLQPTPVKPFPANPYPIRGLHLDCFIKTKGNYIDLLSAENRFDRLKEKGVDTLILHEKWNKSQNWFELSEYTTSQIKSIVSECHKRGIKVLTYFGYEIASMSPIWSEKAEDVLCGPTGGGWYRVPFQRDYIVCYNNEWADRFVNGVAKIMDECHIDGIYLDGTSRPHFCDNVRHGCGWYDEDGKLHGSYPVTAVRSMFKNLYNAVHARGGIINVHASGMINFTALPFIDLSWYGEHLQFDYVHGKYTDVPLDYFRCEYTGRNMGVPVEFIAYENRPIWNFENAISMCIVHGILPRPNDIEGPLDQMAEVWKVFNRFPIAQSEWKPYWTNGADAGDKVKVSYYRYTAVDGKVSLLLFAANMTSRKAENVKISLCENAKLTQWTDLMQGAPFDGTLTLNPYDYRIFAVR